MSYILGECTCASLYLLETKVQCQYNDVIVAHQKKKNKCLSSHPDLLLMYQIAHGKSKTGTMDFFNILLDTIQLYSYCNDKTALSYAKSLNEVQ